MPHVFSFKFAGFALVPTLILLLSAEIAVRLKYVFAHGHEWGYLTGGQIDPQPQPTERPRMPRAVPAASRDQMVFTWQTPCVNSIVYSADLHKTLPRTYDENCFRGDRVSREKAPGEYRIVFLGGSTVEDRQSDAEMMTAQFKNALRLADQRRVTVVNGGRAGFDSLRILRLYDSAISPFSPDLVLYYEAWNEQQIVDRTFRRAEQALVNFQRWRLHRALYNRSKLYTYLVEKYEFATWRRFETTMSRQAHFWKSDVADLRAHFTALVDRVRRDGARFAFVTQVVNWPRKWKGIDTFDYRAVDGLLTRLEADKHYAYNVAEISALNQRLAVAYTITLCQDLHVPVVDILEPIEALGETGRAELFVDLGHRTAKGNKVVGELIARRVSLLD